MMKKDTEAIILGGNTPLDRRKKLQGESKLPRLPYGLKGDLRKQYVYVLRLIKSSPKAATAITEGDAEAVMNLAIALTLQSDLLKRRLDTAKGYDEKTIASLDRRIIQLNADIRQAMDKLLLNPNSRARVVVEESPKAIFNNVSAILTPPK